MLNNYNSVKKRLRLPFSAYDKYHGFFSVLCANIKYNKRDRFNDQSKIGGESKCI